MGQRASTPPLAKSETKSTVWMMVATFGNTTWRMFVPVLIGIAIGYWVDATFETRYGAIIGACIGLIPAGLLVWQQYRAVTRSAK